MRSIENEERKVTDEIKKAGKRGDVNSCRILAKEVVRSRKARERLLESKAQLNSVSMSLQQQAATMRVAGSLEKSTDVMQAMGNLVKVSEISTTVRMLSEKKKRADGRREGKRREEKKILTSSLPFRQEFGPESVAEGHLQRVEVGARV